MLVSNQRPLACETSSATSHLFVNLRYRAGIIRVASVAIFSQFERSRTCAQKFCRELSRILSRETLWKGFDLKSATAIRETDLDGFYAL